LRYSVTQGPRQSLLNQYSGILRIFLSRIKSGLPVIVYEDGRQTRDFVHVKDVVDANLLVLESDSANYQAYNVGSGVRTTVLEFANRLASRLQTDIDLRISRDCRVIDNRHTATTVDRLPKLGW